MTIMKLIYILVYCMIAGAKLSDVKRDVSENYYTFEGEYEFEGKFLYVLYGYVSEYFEQHAWGP